MIIKMNELTKGKQKEIRWRIEHGYARVTKHKKGGPKHLYKNDEEYINEKTEEWLNTFKEKYQKGQIKNVSDIMNLFIKTQTEKQVEQ